MEKVSIVVPIHNAEKYIDACLNSILAQTYSDWELLLVDDGSTDSSGEICDRYAGNDDRINVFHRENSGVSATRNYGIRHATGKYIMFIDSDDTIIPNTLQENVQKLEQQCADIIIYGCQYHILDEDRSIDKPLPEDFAGSGKDFFDTWYVSLLQMESLNPPWNKLIRREVLEKNHISFNENFSICEDMAFTVELLHKCNKILLNKEMYYHYNIKSTGSLVFKFHSNYFQALLYFYEKSMEYCEAFEDRERQEKTLDTIFSNLTIMHLKQICIDSGWDKKHCIVRIGEICIDRVLLQALKHATLSTKKKLVRILIQCKLYRAIYMIYCRG